MFFKEKRHTIPFQDLSKYAAQGTVEMESRATSDRTVVEDTQNCNRDMYLENTVATESNAMLMSYQLIPAVHSAVWSVHRWMIHRLQQSLSKNDLSDITQLVFEVSMSFREKWREVVCGCGAAAAPLLRLSKESPQYWIARWNRQAYSRLHEGNIQSEVRICSLELQENELELHVHMHIHVYKIIKDILYVLAHLKSESFII